MVQVGSLSGLLFLLADAGGAFADPTGATKAAVFLRGHHTIPQEEVAAPNRFVEAVPLQTSYMAKTWWPTSTPPRDLVIYAALGTISVVLLIASIVVGWRGCNR